MNVAKWEKLKDQIRARVGVGESLNIVTLADELGAKRKTIIALEEDMDDFCMNVAVGFGAGGGYANLPKRDWTLENLGDI